MSRRRAPTVQRGRFAERRRWWLGASGGVVGLLVLGTAVWRLTEPALPAPSPAFVASTASLVRLAPTDLHELSAQGGGDTLTLATHEGLVRSNDGGRSWTRLTVGSGEIVTVVTPALGNALSLCGGPDTFAISRDRGATWSRPTTAPGLAVHALAVSAVAPGNFSINVDPRYYAAVAEGLVQSDDGGETWSTPTALPPAVSALTAAKPGQGPDDFLFAVTPDGAFRSLNSGRSWRALPELGPVRSVSALGAIVYAVTEDRLFVSQVGGLSLDARPFPPGGALFVAATTNPDLAVVVNEKREIWRTTDRGRTWERRG